MAKEKSGRKARVGYSEGRYDYPPGSMNVYPQNQAFEMAPNAGVSEGRGIDHVARSHGAEMNLSSKQHNTHDAMIKEWGDMPYSQQQHADGSMNYMEHKMSIAAADAKKVRRPQKGVDNAS